MNTDYGCDPLGDGKFKMVPSGDIVGFEERNRRMAIYKNKQPAPEIFGMTWDKLESMQGGKLTRLK